MPKTMPADLGTLTGAAQAVGDAALNLKRAADAVLATNGEDADISDLLVARASGVGRLLWTIENSVASRSAELVAAVEEPGGFERELWLFPILLLAMNHDPAGTIVSGLPVGHDDPGGFGKTEAWWWYTGAASDSATRLVRWAKDHGADIAEERE